MTKDICPKKQRRYNIMIGKPENTYPYIAISSPHFSNSFEIAYRTSECAAYFTTCGEQPSKETAKTLVQRIEDFLRVIPEIPVPLPIYLPDNNWKHVQKILKRK